MKKKQSSWIIPLNIVFLFILIGCAAHSPHDKTYISDSISARTGVEIQPDDSTATSKADTLNIEQYFNLDDSLSEDDAVAIALLNNPQFRSNLADLGFVEADLIQAGMLKNPVFSLLFPIGPKQLESVLNVPIEFFWQRPYRVAIAQMNAEKVAEDLVQNGLDLIRRIKIAFINYNLALENARIAFEEAAFQSEISRATSARVLLGDMSELEGTAFLLLEAQIKEKGIIFSRDAGREGIQLRGMLGLNPKKVNFIGLSQEQDSLDIADQEILIKRALAARPDLRAAEITIESSAEKIGWEKSKIFNISAIIDANGEGTEGFEIGPGFQMELPLFNRNEAGRTRAEAEFQKAVINYQVVKQKIITEVLQAYNDYLAAQQVLDIFDREIIPFAVIASNNAEKAFEIGETSYIEFLVFKRQLINARLNAAAAEANLKKSIADLQYSVGSNFIQIEESINTDTKE